MAFPSAGAALVAPRTIKLDTMAVITQERHSELIRKEKILDALQEAIQSEDLSKIRDLYWELMGV